MEAPPAYSDLGRHILDLFNLGCDPGLIRLDCKSKTRDAVELGYSSVFGLESRRFTGNVSVGRYLPVRDMNVTGRWATDGALGARVDFYRLVRGVDLTFDAAFYPTTGNKPASARASLGGPSGVDAQCDGCGLVMALATRFQWGAHSTLSATGTFNGFLGLAFSHVLSPGVKLTLCNSFNLNTLNSGGHAVGIGLEFES
uniref:Voltage-dependent anion-selective channel protein 3 n=1 Tax=Eptatretus burgeri TaxID=7764 RepID=A0A8C4QIH3_EPTBU